MTTYEEKRTLRLERLRSRAERLARAADAADARARAISDQIPFGQPVLVGHHSQRRHERDLDRIKAGFARSVKLRDEAAAVGRRLRAAESNHSISSDDPEAILKLREKLATVERERERAAEVNARIRSAKRKGNGWQEVARAELAALGLKPATIDAALAPDFAGRTGVPAYALTNLAAEARRIRGRITVLEREATRPPTEASTLGAIRVEEGDNRVRIALPSKPSEATRALLKSGGFRWSPTAGAWQRQATDNARRDARALAQKIAQQDGEGDRA